MNIMKVIAAALIVSTFGSAIASADTVDHAQTSQQQPLLAGDASVASTAASDSPSQEATTVAGHSAQNAEKPPVFANFGQWDEPGSEN
jgi:hypothetical protein